MFTGKTLRDGSTMYRSRRTGIRWVVSVNRYGTFMLYLNGAPCFSSRTRSGCISHLERGDALFA